MAASSWVNASTSQAKAEVAGLNLANLNHYAVLQGCLHCYMAGNGEDHPLQIEINTPLAQAILKAVGATMQESESTSDATGFSQNAPVLVGET